MEYRQLGESDVKVSAVVMGTWAIGGWLWGGTDDDKAVGAIHKSMELGVTSIDTAPMYGFGHSEEVVARAVAGRRDKVQLLTKFGLRWEKPEGEAFFDTKDDHGRAIKVYRNARPDSIVWECEQSLRRLRTDYIDLYQCHWRDHTTPVEDTMEALAKLIKAGKIRAAGVSNFTIEEIEACRKVLPLASDQPPYSMVKRDIEKDLLPYCKKNHVGVIVYSTLQLGLLSGSLTLERQFPPDDQRSWSPYFKSENRKKVIRFIDEIRPMASNHGATVAQLVIHWTIHREGVTAALVGARDAAQAQENAGASDLHLLGEEMARVDELVEQLKLEE